MSKNMDQMRSMTEDGRYYTTDVGEAAALFTLKYTFLGFKKTDSDTQYYFVYEWDENIPELIGQYWNHTLMVDAKEVLWSFRNLRRRLSRHIEAQL